MAEHRVRSVRKLQVSKIVFDFIPKLKIGFFDKGCLVCIDTDNPNKCINELDNGEMQISDYAEKIILQSRLEFLTSPLWNISTRLVLDCICDHDVPAFEAFLRSRAAADHNALLILDFPRTVQDKSAS